ncbi:Aldehyde oxidase 2 [Carabus blaptoides fortunei]
MRSETSCDTEAVLPDPRHLQEIFTGNEITFSVQGKRYTASAPKAKVNPLYQSGGARLERELSTGTQIYQTHEELYPLTQPVVKLEAMIQCSGEAQYLNDTPPIPGELFGAFVLAEAKPLSLVKNVDASAALAIRGVKAFITHKDIPGINSFTSAALSPTVEQLFCEHKVLYNGQAIGLILAQDQELANAGARAVKVTYEDTTDMPAFNIEDIKKNKQMWRITNAVKMEPRRKGDDIKHVLKGKFEVNAQYHFTMETQSCICVPTDDGGFDLLSATQWMDNVQLAAAKALNIPMNKINVTVKRLGGAYGAKIGRANIVSTACAVASYKMNKPVRIQLPIDTNMKMVGKRVPTLFEYEVATDGNGLIQYLDCTYYQNHGLSGVNESLIDKILSQAQNVYVNDTWKWNGNSIQTDLPGNAFARAPSTAEALGMIESVMEHIAYTLNKEPIDVKLANMLPSEQTMSSLVKDMITWSEYEQRKKAVEEFNSKNRWMKRGISLVIMNYPFKLLGPFSAFVSVYAGDGSVAISHGGIECGQGINTKVAQVCAYTLGIPLDSVSIKPSNSLNAPNNFATAASVTSEGVCYIEGAFVMGLGYYTCENLIYDENGACLTNNTWTYKIPGVKDIPADFRVKFRQDSTNPDGVLNSKVLAEPPLCLAVSIPLAIRRALASARADADPNAERFVPFVGPTTVEFTYQNAKNYYKQYSL